MALRGDGVKGMYSTLGNMKIIIIKRPQWIMRRKETHTYKYSRGAEIGPSGPTSDWS